MSSILECEQNGTSLQHIWINHLIGNFTSVWKQDTRIQKFEADGGQRDGEAALQGRGRGIRGFVGQLCGERRNVHERWTASEWIRGLPFLPRDCQRRLAVAWVKYDI